MHTRLLRLGLAAAFLLAPFGCTAPDPAQEESSSQDNVGTATEALNGFFIRTPIVGAGPGCPAPLAYSVTPDGQTFTVYFSDMILQHPPGSTFQKINCTVGLGLHLPRGHQFSIATIDTRGYAHLPVGTYADQRSKYYFAGHMPELRGHDRMIGFFDNDWSFTDVFPVGSYLTSPCGGDSILNIDTALILNTAGNPTQDAYVDNTTIDGTFRMIFQLGWDTCEG
jgi:hypothetical protein